MTKPTPFFIMAIVAIGLIIFSLLVISATYNHAMNQKAYQLLKSQKQSWAPPAIDRSSGCKLWDCITYNTGEQQ